MPLIVHLSSAQQATPGANVSVEGASGVSLNTTFPLPGVLTTHPFAAAPGLIADLVIYFMFGNDRLRVDIQHLDYDSSVSSASASKSIVSWWRLS